MTDSPREEPRPDRLPDLRTSEEMEKGIRHRLKVGWYTPDDEADVAWLVAEVERVTRDNQRLSVDCNALRLALRSGLPDCLGCGKPFHTFVDAYRCTHCDAYLHKDCAERHFGKAIR